MKITYLIGAGASANTIPVVMHIHKRIEEVLEYLKGQKIPDDKVSASTAIINELQWLLQTAGNYYTIDTLAKKFYLTSDYSNLKKLKKSLIIYFALEQFVNIPSKTKTKENYNFKKESSDKRYGSFIAAITKKRYPIVSSGKSDGNSLAAENREFELSRHVRILSWNYDLQFEMSLQEFTKTVLQTTKAAYQILPNRTTYNENRDLPYLPGRFAMVKLNGDAIWDLEELPSINKWSIVDGKKFNNEEGRLYEFLDRFEKSNQVFESPFSPVISFNFAWENDNNFREKYVGHSKNLEAAEAIAAETEILVVIGYSFPVFNREIDSKLFTKMANLKKVYIQDKNPDRIKSTMVNAFKILQQTTNEWSEKDLKYVAKPLIDFQLEQYTDQFLIPYELAI